MTKILSIVPYSFLPAKIGGQKGIALFYQFFSRYADVTCIATRNNDTSFAEGYHVEQIFGNSASRYINIFNFFPIKRIIRQKKITHVIIEHPYFGWLGILLQKFLRVKLIIHSHNIESLRFKGMNKWWWKILWQYEKFTHTNADHNFFITDEDREYAVKNFKLDPDKCITVTYGFELNNRPSPGEKDEAKKYLQKKHTIPATEKILLFNGALDYKPNTEAVRAILSYINPLLLCQPDFAYKIIICGKNLPEEFNELKDYSDRNIIFPGFVDDISVYFKGADIFINPVVEGGGIKTKLVEALGYNSTAVTTQSGSFGVPLQITGSKMKVVQDTDWENFSGEIRSADTDADIPDLFFEHFYWDNIAKKAIAFINPDQSTL